MPAQTHPSPPEKNSTPSDTSGLHKPVIGEDLVLVRGESGSMYLYYRDTRWIGEFTDVLSAWVAIDAIDLAGEQASLAQAA
jgi:hypothetical protein